MINLNYCEYHKEWINNTTIGVKSITLLELLEVICRKEKHITRGKI